MAENTTPDCPTKKDDSIPNETANLKEEPQLPKLTPQEYSIYNRLSVRMNMFHDHFRQTWNTLYTATTTNKRPHGMSLRAFLRTADEFCQQLTFHHTIEEEHIFPILAKKMPAFEKELQLLSQHKLIHAGLEKLESYIEECRSGERELRMEEMKGIMDGFGKVLWEHLDEEVHELRGENMRRYWSIAEMGRIPM